MPTLTHRGFTQHFELEGHGPDLVWAHGQYMSAEKDEAFFGFFPDLRRRYRMLTYDARGHGRSGYTVDPADYTFDSLAGDLESLLEHLGIGRTALYGGSMGSITALTFAAAHPERVRCLVLFQPTCIGPDVRKVGRVTRMMVKAIERQGMAAAAEFILGIGPWSALAERDPERVATLRAGVGEQVAEAVIAASLGVTRLPGWDAERLEQLRALKIPVLLIAEPEDPVHPRTSAEQLHAVLPDSHLIVAPSNYHYFAHPDALRDLLLEFLEAHQD